MLFTSLILLVIFALFRVIYRDIEHPAADSFRSASRMFNTHFNGGAGNLLPA